METLHDIESQSNETQGTQQAPAIGNARGQATLRGTISKLRRQRQQHRPRRLGSAESNFLRKTPAAYADGMATPVDDRPNARTISNRLASQGDRVLINDRDLSAFVYAWGQFLDHDIDLTQADPARAPFSIPVHAATNSSIPIGQGTRPYPWFVPSLMRTPVLPLANLGNKSTR